MNSEATQFSPQQHVNFGGVGVYILEPIIVWMGTTNRSTWSPYSGLWCRPTLPMFPEKGVSVFVFILFFPEKGLLQGDPVSWLPDCGAWSKWSCICLTELSMASLVSKCFLRWVLAIVLDAVEGHRWKMHLGHTAGQHCYCTLGAIQPWNPGTFIPRVRQIQKRTALGH